MIEDWTTERARQTRRSLHAIAEQVLAGPQHRRSGTIRLRPATGGFATVAEPPMAVDGGDLVTGERRFWIDGSTLSALAAAAGLEVGAPQGIYPDVIGFGADDRLVLDSAVAADIAEWLQRGQDALTRFAPDAAAVLWPEHFDLGVTVGDVNYGVSPGDDFSPEPYAYVGPHAFGGPAESAGGAQGFFNAPFGAYRTMSDLQDADAVVAFFEAGRLASHRAARTMGEPE